jgi:hypothetical protein
MRIPWWLNPWRETAQLRQERDALTRQVDNLLDDVTYAQEQSARLLQLVDQLRADPGGTPSTGKVEFVLVGIDRMGAGKRLIASRELTGTRFDMTAIHEPPPRHVIKATMERALFIDGLAYSDAMDQLRTIWANWEREDAAAANRPRLRAVDEGKLGLPPGTTWRP